MTTTEVHMNLGKPAYHRFRTRVQRFSSFATAELVTETRSSSQLDNWTKSSSLVIYCNNGEQADALAQAFERAGAENNG